MQNYQFGAISKDGTILLPIEYDGISYSGHTVTIKKNNLKGGMSYDRHIFIAPAYDDIDNISDQFFSQKRHSLIYCKQGGKRDPCRLIAQRLPVAKNITAAG